MSASALLVFDLLALGLAARVKLHRAVLWLLAFAAVNEAAIWALQALVLADAPRPFEGYARAAYHVETALVLAWPAVTAASARKVFLSRGPGWLFEAWSLWLCALIAVYPLPRGWTAPALRTFEIACLAVGMAAIGKAIKRGDPIDRSGIVCGLVVAVELAVSLLGSWAHGAGVFASWDQLARVQYGIAWAVIIVLCATWGRPWRR